MAINKSNVLSESDAVSSPSWKPGDNLDGMHASESNAVASTDSIIPEQRSNTDSGSVGSIIDWLLKLLSSVRFGLVMLGTLLTCCMIGMLIMQINVEGFQKYYSVLSPAKKVMY